MSTNRFNLIDEPWIAVADFGRVSLAQIFSDNQYRSLGGDPIQKIAILKLLLAIAQAAITPEDEQQWRALTRRVLAQRCLEYLAQWHDRFYLYGEQPFLQMPSIQPAKLQPFGALKPEIATGNTTVLSQIHQQRQLDEADQALLLLSLMGFSLSGKKTDNSVVLSDGYAGKRNDKGKPASGRTGTSLGFMGLLHSFIWGNDLQETIWLNLLTQQQIAAMGIYPQGLGIAPWQQMPTGEDCPVAQRLKQSLMGRLIPMGRFCLLDSQGMHYSEGIAHLGFKDGMFDPSMAINYAAKQPKALWVNPDKRPWRELTALLGFFEQSNTQGLRCWQLDLALDRAIDQCQSFAIWSGGLRVSSNAGEQYVSGSDDFVESQVWLDANILGSRWYSQLKQEMEALDQLAKMLYGRVIGYFKEQKLEADHIAGQATELFWQLCERNFQTLIDCCDAKAEHALQRLQLRRQFANDVHTVYDQFCAKDTARQIQAWVKCRPTMHRYLQHDQNTEV